MRSLFVTLTICLTLFSTPALAFEIQNERPTVVVTALASGEGFTPAQQRVIQAFERAVRVEGLDQAGGEALALFVDATEIGHLGETHLVLSITVLAGLPEPIVHLGAIAEAFYFIGDVNTEGLPQEGADVRRALSAEWLRQYHEIREHTLLVIPPAELDERAAAIVAGLR